MARDGTPTVEAMHEFGVERRERLRVFVERHGDMDDVETLHDVYAEVARLRRERDEACALLVEILAGLPVTEER